MNNLPTPISVTNELLDRFPQFAGTSEVVIGDVLTALAGESDHERSEAAVVVDRLEASGQTVRLVALADQLGALLASMLPGAQAAQAIWQQIVSEVERVAVSDSVWSEIHDRYTDVVTEQAFTIASMIANENVR